MYKGVKIKKILEGPKDPLAPQTLITATERKLFGFKCAVQDGTLAERETERRMYAFFAVLSETHVSLHDTQKEIEVVPDSVSKELLAHLFSIYREAEKELSTENILTDILEYFHSHQIVLRHTPIKQGGT